MRQHVGVRMAQEPPRVRDVYAAQDELAPLGERVHVVALPDAQGRRIERLMLGILRLRATRSAQDDRGLGDAMRSAQDDRFRHYSSTPFMYIVRTAAASMR